MLYFCILTTLTKTEMLAQVSPSLLLFYFWFSLFFVNIWVLFIFYKVRECVQSFAQLFIPAFQYIHILLQLIHWQTLSPFHFLCHRQSFSNISSSNPQLLDPSLDDSGMKNTHCSCRGPEFSTQHSHQAARNCLQVELKWIVYPLLAFELSPLRRTHYTQVHTYTHN